MKTRKINFDSDNFSDFNEIEDSLTIEIFLIAARIKQIEQKYKYIENTKSKLFFELLNASKNLLDKSDLNCKSLYKIKNQIHA